MRHVAQYIISEEFRAGDVTDTQARAAFRACEKLRRSLSVLTGAGGFRSLLSRALTLAKAEAAWLGTLEIATDGALILTAEQEAQAGREASACGGAVLIASLLELLVVLVGEKLTLRLVQDVWPRAASEKPGNEKKDQL